MISNLIISTLLTFQTYMPPDFDAALYSGFQPPSVSIQALEKSPTQKSGLNLSPLEESRLTMYFQSAALIYKDIYECTKPSLYKVLSINGIEYQVGEKNPVADLFFKNNLWDLAFVCANAFNYFMFNVDDFYYLYSTALSVAEILAIASWGDTMSEGLNAKANLFVITF